MGSRLRLFVPCAGVCIAWCVCSAARADDKPAPTRDSPPSEGGVRGGITIPTQGHSPGDFWSFQPVRIPALPSVANDAWCRSPIDRFVLERLESRGLRPVPAAAKRTLIRRATFDLIGLPPTPAEIDAFLADESPHAFDRLIDQLLNSPHYGERWARHWMDVARYGEDQAHSFKPRLYPHGFRYRDWLVQALNADMPYDRFLIEQIAGDLVDEPGRTERLPALGFFALGPVYYGDPKKLDQLDDRIDTLTRGVLGLTVACARCHDHKYDPVPIADYYALARVVAGAEYVEAPFAAADVVAAYDRAMAPIDAMGKQIDEFLGSASSRMARDMAADEIARYLRAVREVKLRRLADPGVSTGAVAKERGVQPFLLDAWLKYLSAPDTARRPQLARWLQSADAAAPACDCPTCDAAACDRAPCGDPGTSTCRHAACAAASALERYVRSLIGLRQAIEEHKNAAAANSSPNSNSTAATAATPAPAASAPAIDPAELQLLDEITGPKGPFSIPKDKIEGMLAGDAKNRLTAMRAELEQLKKNAPPKYPVVHTLTAAASPVAMPVLSRGNPEMPGDEAPHQFLSALGGRPFSGGHERLELARAIASPDNPLTARVIVNRIWHHHFGTGLVATPSNFGALGEPPTHPELLDYLAGTFVGSGWSIKSLHREIMQSATYQLASSVDAANHEIDPANRLWWRQNRRRLEIEPWRDAMLAVSDTLDRTVGGPSLPLSAADNRRRTLYGAISRHDLDPLLRLFDFPDPNITAGQRVTTTVPLQQLFVLNSPFMEHSARVLAERMIRSSDDDAARIRGAILSVYGRPATDEEVAQGLAFLQSASIGRSGSAPSAWEQYAHALLAANEFLYVD